MRMRWGMLAAVAAVGISTSAMAQDVIVMRRVLAPPVVDRDAQGYDQATFHWETGPWVNNPSCSASTTQTRLVGCVKRRVQQDDSACPTPKPDTTRTVEDYTTCGFSWQVTGHGPWDSTCSAHATRTTDSVCVRSDGTTVADTNCSGQPKPGIDGGEVTTSCSYTWHTGDWGPYADHCSATATRSRAVTCRRSDGVDSGDANCQGAKPATAETGQDFSGCGFSWKTGDWSVADSTCSESATQTRDVHCERQDGTTSADASCTGTRPNATQTVQSLSGCTYDWKPGDWSDYSSTCSATATRTRNVACLRSDGTPADSDGRCTKTKDPTSETTDVSTSCTYKWDYSAWNVVPACGNTTQSRTATCRRSDGSDGGSHCAGQAQDTLTGTVYDTQTCGYSWKPGDWSDYSPSTCSDAATRTRTEACVRSDNQPVADALCAGKTHNTLSEGPSGVYSGCAHAWSYGAWVSASTCSNSTTQTATGTCMRTINGAQVAVEDSWCPAGGKTKTQAGIADTSSCGTAWSYTAWTPSPPTGTCTSSYAQTRTATCVATLSAGGTTPVADARCTQAKDILSQSIPVTSGCTWSWNYPSADVTTGFTAWSNTCGTATRTRNVICRRSDAPGTQVPDAQCNASGSGAGARPVDTQTSTQTTDCTGKLVNGNMELSTGWTFDTGVSYNSVNDPNGSLKAVHAGTRSLLINSSTYGRPSIYQTFPTTAGAKYSISYWAWHYGPQVMVAFVNNVQVASTPGGGGNGSWQQASALFTATGSTTTVKFTPSYSNYGYLSFDDVVVSQIP